MIGVKPSAPGDKTSERLGQLDDERLPSGGGDILAPEQGFADRREMPETLDNAIERKRSNIRIAILDEQQAGFGRTHLGEGCGDGARQRGAARDRRLDRGCSGRHRVDQIGVDE